MRSVVAARIPIMMTRPRLPLGRPDATSPTMMALSPASTRSTRTTWAKALNEAKEIIGRDAPTRLGQGSAREPAAAASDFACCEPGPQRQGAATLGLVQSG